MKSQMQISSYTCDLDAAGALRYWMHAVGMNGSNSTFGPYAFDTWTPVNPCTGSTAPNTQSGLLPGKWTQNSSFCGATTDPGSGGTVYCQMKVTVSGLPTMNQWGSWGTPGASTATGELCGDGKTNTGIKTASGDAPPAPVPPDPNTNPPKSPPPKSCGGGSCYDPTNDNFCGVDAAGTQFCVPGNTARTPGGGCASSGDSTLCAGSPTAPPPPSNKVPDPPSAITNHDSWTQADPSTGANQTIIVNNYTNQGGAPTTSGQQAGDSGPPASASTAPTPPGSYGGGGDCASPPVCQGDAVMCGIARQEWTSMCQAKADAAQLHKDLAGNGPPSDFDALKSKYGQGDVWSDADTSQDGTVGGQANAGIYDQSGFGFGTTCPLRDMSISLGSRGTFVIPLADKCMVGDWLRALVIGFALFGAAIITAGGKGEA